MAQRRTGDNGEQMRLAARPVEALRALEEIQRSIGHTEGLVRTLERLQDLSPTLSRAREIASLHASHGNAAGQRQALRLLVTRFAGTREDYLALARLEAAGIISPGDAEALKREAAAVVAEIEALGRRATDVSVAKHPVALDIVAVEQGGAVYQ